MIWKSHTRFINKGGADANAAAQENFFNQLVSNYSHEYGQFTNMTNYLESQIQPIISKGIDQYGFSDQEDAALRTSASDTNSTQYQNATKSLNENIAAKNGDTYVPNGADDQLREKLAVAGAQQEAGTQNAITEAGYAQGRQNYLNALGEYSGLTGMFNPNAFAGSANGAGNNANNALEVEAQMDNGWMGALGGALGGLGSAFSGAGTKAVFGNN